MPIQLQKKFKIQIKRRQQRQVGLYHKAPTLVVKNFVCSAARLTYFLCWKQSFSRIIYCLVPESAAKLLSDNYDRGLLAELHEFCVCHLHQCMRPHEVQQICVRTGAEGTFQQISSSLTADILH